MDSYVHPYETDEDTTTDTETTGTTDSEESQAHDGQMQALDQWRAQAQSWITAPGRQPVSSTILEHEPENEGTLTDLPSNLRAKDLRKRVINIDSRFRDSALASSSDFYFNLLTPIRNVLRVRIVSIEFPNEYPFFTEMRQNVTIGVVIGAGSTIPITVPAGNYTASELEGVLQSLLDGAVGVGTISVTFNTLTRKVLFESAGAFSIDTTVGSIDRPFDYGLGYYLGLGRGVYIATQQEDESYAIESDRCFNLRGDSYVLLKVHNFDNVIHQTEENDLSALAKVVLRKGSTITVFEDSQAKNSKEVVFTNPQDLTRLRVQVLDAYGEVIDLCSDEFSFSLEVLEITNHTLAERLRDSMMVRF